MLRCGPTFPMSSEVYGGGRGIGDRVSSGNKSRSTKNTGLCVHNHRHVPKKNKTKKKHHQRVKSVLNPKRQRVKTKTVKVQIPRNTSFVPSCWLVLTGSRLYCFTVSWSQLVGCFVIGWVFFLFFFFLSVSGSDEMSQFESLLCCYCSVRCSLVSPCLEGWLGDGAWEGCVPEGRVWAMGTPPGTMPSNAPGMPPGATPTTPGGYL